MGLRAIRVADNEADYFRQKSDAGPFLRTGDILLRYSPGHRHIFTDFIRLATQSKWSHSALIYLEPDPNGEYEQICIVDSTPETGTRSIGLAQEIQPLRKHIEGVKQLRLDWYVETPQEAAERAGSDADVHGITYLRKVRDVALAQVHSLYDHKTIWELTALYFERMAKHRLGFMPQVADMLGAVEKLLEKWDEASSEKHHWLQFICSGVVQYSFFEALRQHILANLDIPANRQAALSNLNHLQHVVFCDDPDGYIADYIREVQTGKRDLAEGVPEKVLNVLRTATPADFNNSPRLQWRYIVNKRQVWQIYEATEHEEAAPQSKEEREILALMKPDTGPLAR
jgi:hypothetical protein